MSYKVFCDISTEEAATSIELMTLFRSYFVRNIMIGGEFNCQAEKLKLWETNAEPVEYVDGTDLGTLDPFFG